MSKVSFTLKIVEEKKYYSIYIDSSLELKKFTEDIQKNHLEAKGKLMQEFGKILAKAHELTKKANIRYEDYFDRVCASQETVLKTLLV